MISINSMLEVDLLGQCNAEFIGGYQFSGTGGQLDFVRGAFDSKGGKALIADDMGLGKTIQAIGYLQLHRKDSMPALIVAPASVKI